MKPLFKVIVRTKAIRTGVDRMRVTHTLIGVGKDGRIFTSLSVDRIAKAKHRQ